MTEFKKNGNETYKIPETLLRLFEEVKKKYRRTKVTA